MLFTVNFYKSKIICQHFGPALMRAVAAEEEWDQPCLRAGEG